MLGVEASAALWCACGVPVYSLSSAIVFFSRTDIGFILSESGARTRYRLAVDDEVQEKQLRPSYFPIDFDMIVDNDSSTGPTVCASGKHRKRTRSGSQPSIGMEASAALWCACGVPV